MSAIPSPALALTRAFDRFERSSAGVINAAAGIGDADLATELINQQSAVRDVQAALTTVRFSDEMFQALIEIGKEPRDY